MTLEKTCQILQAFPILLILVQKKEICKHTPLVYIPPQEHDKNQYNYGHAMQSFATALSSNRFGGGEYFGGVGGGGYYGGASPSYVNSYPTSYSYPGYSYGSNRHQYYYPSNYYNSYGRKANGKNVQAAGKTSTSLDGRSEEVNSKIVELQANNSGDAGSPCETPDGLPGYCRNIRKCSTMLDIVLKVRTNPSVAVYLRNSLCRFEGSDPVVCCPDIKLPINEESNDIPLVKSGVVISEEENCGISNSTTFRVVNGQPAKLGQFPWMALLGYRPRRNTGNARWLCGGTLINHQYVVTAAHCIHGHESEIYLVRLGELDLDRDDEGATPIDFGIEKLIPHEQYNPVRFMNDIAAIKLAGYVDFADLIKPICLPTSEEFAKRDLVRNKPFLAGWGDTQFRGPASPTLQYLQLPIISTDICHDVYIKVNKQVSIDKRQICAGFITGKMDACQGDSGGPLMFPQVNPTTRIEHYYLIGVVSFGYKCAEPGYPGVYTRVTEFIPWLLNVMQQ